MTAATSPALDIAQAMLSPEAIADPYPLYARAQELARLQGTGDVLRVPEWNMALAFSHGAVSAVLRSPAAVSGGGFFQEEDQEGGGVAYPEAMLVLKPMMLFHNGASHTRLRSLAQAAFTPRVVAGSRELVQSRLDRLLQSAAGKAEFDAVADLAVPLPVGVITEMLGLKGEDEAKFREWSGAVAELLGGSNGTPELMQRVERQAHEMRGYFRGLADELRAHPQPGLLSALAAVEDGGERLSSDELLANAVLLLAAGHETTTNLISGGLLELSRQPEAWAALVERPELAVSVTEVPGL